MSLERQLSKFFNIIFDHKYRNLEPYKQREEELHLALIDKQALIGEKDEEIEGLRRTVKKLQGEADEATREINKMVDLRL